MLGPFGRVCPLDLETGFLEVNHNEANWPIPKAVGPDGTLVKMNSGFGFICNPISG